MEKPKKKMSSRKAALLWMVLTGIVVAVLIAYEQISILYLLATLGIAVLLLIVAFSDLEGVGRQDDGDIASR